MPTGRPTKYNESIVKEICSRIASGESLLQICRDKHMPSRISVHSWLLDDRYKEFLNRYTRARELQADYIFDELLDIADDGSNDWIERETKSGRIIEVVNQEHVQRSRLRVDTRKWYLSKVLPKKYGDRIDDNDGQDERLDEKVKFNNDVSHETFNNRVSSWN